MDLTKGKEKAIELLNNLKEAALSLPPRFFSLTDELLARFPENRRRPILFAFGGALVLFFILIIAILTVNPEKPKKISSPDMAAGPAIPPGDLFIPAEPDFLPEFLLERDPRRSWSLEDIRPYWRNPDNSEFWRGEIQSAVDKLMEGVR